LNQTHIVNITHIDVKVCVFVKNTLT